jgi:hypothetical protein
MSECKICCYAFNQTTRYPMVLPCGHTFCKHCANELESSSKLCPLDRRPFTDPMPNEQLAQLIESCKLNKNIEGLFKVAFVGDENVGKTCTINAFKGKTIPEVHRPTIGYGFEYIDEIYKGRVYRVQIWDTAGQ